MIAVREHTEPGLQVHSLSMIYIKKEQHASLVALFVCFCKELFALLYVLKPFILWGVGMANSVKSYRFG